MKNKYGKNSIGELSSLCTHTGGSIANVILQKITMRRGEDLFDKQILTNTPMKTVCISNVCVGWEPGRAKLFFYCSTT